MVYPRFISAHKKSTPEDIICLRLEEKNSKYATYYRDGGQWYATVKMVNGILKGKLVIDEKTKFYAVECTYDVWKKNNEPYGNSIKENENE